MLRHGLSTANFDGIVQGQKNYPLHPLGVRQATQLGTYWAMHERSYDLIISSPLQRAKQTAEIVSKILSIHPIVEDPMWIERDFGKGEGLTYEQIEEQFDVNTRSSKDLASSALQLETELDLQERAGKAVESILRKPHSNILVVSHGGILAAVMRSILDIRYARQKYRPPGFRFENTGYTDLIFDNHDSWWHILSHNSRPHLEPIV